MTLADVSRVAAELDGVAERRKNGLLDWRYRGRLVARQLDDSHVVIRAAFELRDFLLYSFPETFSAPGRFARHMMVVADLEHGNADAIEDAVIAAWELQSGKYSSRGERRRDLGAALARGGPREQLGARGAVEGADEVRQLPARRLLPAAVLGDGLRQRLRTASRMIVLAILATVSTLLSVA